MAPDDDEKENDDTDENDKIQEKMVFLQYRGRVQICIDKIRTSDKSDFNFEKTENCASVFKTVDREIF